MHFHPEYELNFIQHAANAERIVGDHKSLIEMHRGEFCSQKLRPDKLPAGYSNYRKKTEWRHLSS